MKLFDLTLSKEEAVVIDKTDQLDITDFEDETTEIAVISHKDQVEEVIDAIEALEGIESIVLKYQDTGLTKSSLEMHQLFTNYLNKKYDIAPREFYSAEHYDQLDSRAIVRETLESIQYSREGLFSFIGGLITGSIKRIVFLFDENRNNLIKLEKTLASIPDHLLGGDKTGKVYQKYLDVGGKFDPDQVLTNLERLYRSDIEGAAYLDQLATALEQAQTDIAKYANDKRPAKNLVELITKDLEHKFKTRLEGDWVEGGKGTDKPQLTIKLSDGVSIHKGVLNGQYGFLPDGYSWTSVKSMPVEVAGAEATFKNRLLQFIREMSKELYDTKQSMIKNISRIEIALTEMARSSITLSFTDKVTVRIISLIFFTYMLAGWSGGIMVIASGFVKAGVAAGGIAMGGTIQGVRSLLVSAVGDMIKGMAFKEAGANMGKFKGSIDEMLQVARDNEKLKETNPEAYQEILSASTKAANTLNTAVETCISTGITNTYSTLIGPFVTQLETLTKYVASSAGK